MKRFIVFLIFFLIIVSVEARDNDVLNNELVKDTAYYDPLTNYLTTKFLLTNKFYNFKINDLSLNQSITYNSRPRNTIGIGAAYRWLNFSLNVALKHPTDSIYGNRRKIDFQTAIYLRRFTVNIYTGIYNGYYLENSAKVINGWPTEMDYVRNDIKTNTFGLGASYIFNSDKYSNKAAFVQKEWQKKSAGSFLAGGSIIWNEIKADSSFIPTNISDTNFYNGLDFNYSNIIKISCEGGYAHTFVLKKHLFFNFSVLGGIGVGRTNLTPLDADKISSTEINFSVLSNAGFGYNSRLFFIGFNYANLFSQTPSPIEKSHMGYSTGRFQLVAAYRFKIPEHKSLLPKWVPVEL